MTDVGLSYVPGESALHQLDARTKLLVQFVVALLAFTWSHEYSLAVVWGIVAMGVLGGRLRLRPLLTGYSLPFALLAIGIIVRTLTLGPPWVNVPAGLAALDHSLHVAAVLVASAIYVRTTPVSETQAAIERVIPGRPGLLLAAGTSFVLRFLPVLLDDLQAARTAQWARLGDTRSLRERMQTVAIAGLNRAFGRADRFSLALKARCFAWNPTPPPMAFTIRDWMVSIVALAVLGIALAY